jgi:Fic family protein
MISQHDLDANPGNLRRGWVGVRNSQTGEVVHEGAPREGLEALLRELVDYMNVDDGTPAELKAAMAHLNLTMIHPFSDGNGRTARCLQTAVLAKQGIVAPEFSSIEEYIGRHQQAYYDVLAEVGGGKWQPQRDCRPWVRFCLTGHYQQAQTLLRRISEVEAVYNELVKVTAALHLPERTALGLIEGAFGRRIRNASYRVTTDVTNNLASRDLKSLVDAGLLSAVGEKKGRHYVATDRIKQIRAKHRLPRGDDDPFAPGPSSAQGLLI